MNTNFDAEPYLPHDQFLRYIYDQLSPAEKANLSKIRNERGEYDYLLELADNLKIGTRQKDKDELDTIEPLSFDQLEDLLGRQFSGSIEQDERQQLLDALLAFPMVYDRLIVLLPSISSAAALSGQPETSGVAILDDDTVMRTIILPNLGEGDEQSEHSIERVQEGSTVPAISGSWLTNILGGLSSALSKPIYQATSVLAILTVAALLFLPGLWSGPFDNYVYGDHVPYEYQNISFRSPNLRSLSAQIPSDMVTFERQFKSAISDYILLRYDLAIARLQALAPLAAKLQSSASIPEVAEMLCDYHFYLGLSHLGLGRSDNGDITKEDVSQHLLAAQDEIERAREIASTINQRPSDRETFFLAVTTGILKQKQIAISLLERIPSDSPFYDESKDLLDQLQ